VQNFVFGLLCFVIIFIMVDMFENLDRFIDKNIGFPRVVLYYSYCVPDILKLILPVGMLLASLFTISRFVNYSELTAMRSAGISIYRYLLPIMSFGLIITLSSIYFNGWIVPKSNRLKFEFERKQLGRNKISDITQNLFFQDRINRIIIINSYNNLNYTCDKVSMLVFRTDTLQILEKRADIGKMNWDTVAKDWKAESVFLRSFNKESETLNLYDSVYFAALFKDDKISLEPDKIYKKQLKPEEMVLSEFSEFISNFEKAGQKVSKEKVDYYSIISFPFANLITILFGVSIASNKRKAGAALHFGISIIVSFVYLGFVKISHVFGYNGDINPVFTAWLANILFFTISLLNFYRLNRS
jgi:lipopolysaccharide export system permease protein